MLVPEKLLRIDLAHQRPESMTAAINDRHLPRDDAARHVGIIERTNRGPDTDQDQDLLLLDLHLPGATSRTETTLEQYDIADGILHLIGISRVLIVLAEAEVEADHLCHVGTFQRQRGKQSGEILRHRNLNKKSQPRSLAQTKMLRWVMSSSGSHHSAQLFLLGVYVLTGDVQLSSQSTSKIIANNTAQALRQKLDSAAREKALREKIIAARRVAQAKAPADDKT
jgi:hypothetical protein